MSKAQAISNEIGLDVKKLGESIPPAFAEAAADFAGKAGETIDTITDKTTATVRSVAAQGREAGDRVQEVASNMRGAVDKSIADQPMTTLAIAAGVGFVLGALWRS